jgi:hypothetical protein
MSHSIGNLPYFFSPKPMHIQVHPEVLYIHREQSIFPAIQGVRDAIADESLNA